MYIVLDQITRIFSPILHKMGSVTVYMIVHIFALFTVRDLITGIDE